MKPLQYETLLKLQDIKNAISQESPEEVELHLNGLEKSLDPYGYQYLLKLINIKAAIENGDFGGGGEFPSTWHSSGTMAQLIADINSDEEATVGNTYMKTVTLSDLPADITQGELRVDIIEDDATLGKVLLFTLTNNNTSPYHWEYISAYSAGGVWRSFATSEQGNKADNAIPSPRVPGTEGQVLALDAHGNPIWVDAAAGGTYDGTISETSTNAPQSKAVKKYVDDNFAMKHGYYQRLRSGVADNLFSPISVIQKYLFGPTAEGSEVASGPAFLRAFKGNGVAWNQLIQNGDFANGDTGWGAYNNATESVSSGVCTMLATQQNGSVRRSIAIVATHKYFVSAKIKASSSLVKLSIYGGALASHSGSGNYELLSGIFISPTDANALVGVIDTRSSDWDNVDFTNVEVHDLTLEGIDNLSTAAQVEDWLRKNAGAKPYYGYNAGTLLGATLKGFKSWKTANLLNPTTKTARLFEYTYGEAVNKYTIQQLPADASLYFTPDATGVEAAVTMVDTTHFSVSGQGTLAVKTSDGSAAYAGDVSEVWLVAYYDGAMDSYDNYKPFAQDVKTIDAGKIYYDNAGTKTKVWADGVMKAAPNAQDELRYDDLASKWKATLPIKEVNLETLAWSYNSTYTCFIASPADCAIGVSGKKQVICGRYAAYPTVGLSSLGTLDKAVLLRTNNASIIIRDSAYTDADTFKTAMAGVKLWFELATPLTYDTLYYSEDGETFVPLEDVLTPDLLVNNWAAQEVEVSDYVDGNPTAVTPEVEIEYMEDAVEALKTYKDEAVLIEDQHDQVQAILEAFKTANIISAYTLADVPTSGTKVFAVEVTKYTEE